MLALSLMTCAAHADGQPASTPKQNMSQPKGMINSPARPYLIDQTDVCLTGDFLWWQATENGLSFGIRNRSEYLLPNGHTPNDLSDSEVLNIKGEWDPGFRVGLGLNTKNDGWDISLNWLRFNTDHKKEISAKPGQWLVPSLLHPADVILNDRLVHWPNSGVSKAYSKWELELNQLDLNLGREFFVGNKLTLRPNVGIRSAWIHQELETLYKVSAQQSGGGAATFVGQRFRGEVEMKNHFWGVGPTAGLDSQWMLGEGWSIYGNLEAALLYGCFEVKREDELSAPLVIDGSKAETEFVDIENSYRDLRAIVDLQLGVKWSRNFNHDQERIALHAGWESHVYFDQNQFMYFADDINIGTNFTNQGNLNLQGWTIGAEFDF